MERIVVVGEELRKALGEWTSSRFRCTSVTAFRAEGPGPCALVALGDDALRALAPVATLDAARRAGADVWVVSADARPAVLVPWLDRDRASFVPPPAFLDALVEFITRLGRPHVPIEEIVDLPDSRLCSEAKRMLSALPRLRRLRSKEWAAVLGVGRYTLTRRCKRYFGVPSDEIMWRWVVGAVTRLRAAGATVDHCAPIVGYSDGCSLHRAFRNRGLAIPGIRAIA